MTPGDKQSEADKKEEAAKRYESNKKQFLEAVFTPAEFQKICDAIDASGLQERRKAEDYVDYWIDELKVNTSTIERIIEMYMGCELSGGFILAKSLRASKGEDSEYFERVYGRLVEQLQGDTSYDGFTPVDKPTGRVGCGKKWGARAAAIGRITSQPFLKRVVEEVPDNCYFGYESPQAIAAGRIKDQPFLERILETKTDPFIVQAAISRLTNKKLLRHYANRPGSECDQKQYEFGSPAQTEAFHKAKYRDAARQRLRELN